MDLARTLADAYRWHRRLGAQGIDIPHGHIVVDPAHPSVWDRNHADDVTADTPAEIEAVLAEMEARLSHCGQRVVHTDAFTPGAFLAQLAFADFRPMGLTIQMALEGEPADCGAALDLRPVESAADWRALTRLALANHAEGRSTHDLALSEDVSRGLVAGYRSKAPACRFHMAYAAGEPVAYGAHALAPNGAGMIEDLFVLPQARRRGLATALIAAFAHRLRGQGAQLVFLGALADEAPKRLYRRLGFRPVTSTQMWVKPAP